MSVIMGLALGAGLLLIWWSYWPRTARLVERRQSKTQQLIAQSGIAHVTLPGMVTLSVILALVVLISLTALTGAIPIGISFGLFAAASPWAALAWQAKRRQTILREVWPDAIDNLRSAVRAGLTLPEALAQLSERGPEELRDVFETFALDYRAGARFTDALDRLKQSLADPTGDRLIAALKVTREVGGADIGRLLETLSDFLRDDARTRAELGLFARLRHKLLTWGNGVDEDLTRFRIPSELEENPNMKWLVFGLLGAYSERPIRATIKSSLILSAYYQLPSTTDLTQAAFMKA